LFFTHIFTQSLSIYIQQRPKCPQAHSTLIFDYISSAKMLILAILGQVGLSLCWNVLESATLPRGFTLIVTPLPSVSQSSVRPSVCPSICPSVPCLRFSRTVNTWNLLIQWRH